MQMTPQEMLFLGRSLGYSHSRVNDPHMTPACHGAVPSDCAKGASFNLSGRTLIQRGRMRLLFKVQGEGRGPMTQAIALKQILTGKGHEICAGKMIPAEHHGP
jgi:hypothetical protein